MERKESNPKDAAAAAQGRLQFSVIPWRAVPRLPATPAEWMVYTEVALAMAEGAWKYGRHNYRVAGVRASVYFDAAMRHLVALEMGEEIDPDSGVHHRAKAIAGLLVLRDAIMSGGELFNDDRPPYTLCASEEACAQEWEATPIGWLMSWLDDAGGDDHYYLDEAIAALVSARANAFAATSATVLAVHAWRGLAREGVAALRSRMGNTPHTPPYTALEVAATRHDTEPPSATCEIDAHRVDCTCGG